MTEELRNHADYLEGDGVIMRHLAAMLCRNAADEIDRLNMRLKACQHDRDGADEARVRMRREREEARDAQAKQAKEIEGLRTQLTARTGQLEWAEAEIERLKRVMESAVNREQVRAEAAETALQDALSVLDTLTSSNNHGVSSQAIYFQARAAASKCRSVLNHSDRAPSANTPLARSGAAVTEATPTSLSQRENT